MAESLNFALMRKDFARVQQLLRSASAQDIDQSEGLLRAVQLNQPGLMQLMFKQGANPNAEAGLLPLRQAVRNGNSQLVQLLLQHGANPNRQEHDTTDSILQEALSANAYGACLYRDTGIERLPQLNAQRLEAIRLILKAGANPNERDRSNGTTVLMVAIAHGNEELVELLLQRGANPKVISAYGETALHYAAWRGNTAVVQQLLAQKVGVNPAHYLGRTPLIFAVRQGSLPIVKLLLAQGANVNAASREGFAEPNGTRYGYQSVLDHAIAANYPDIVALLKQRGAKPFQ
jgi:ankyrin repeat protein